MARTKFSTLRGDVVATQGASERIAALRSEALEEIRLFELRHREAVSQAELAGRLDVTQGAISKLEHADDVRVSTLRHSSRPSEHGWNSSRSSTTRTAACRFISAETAWPEPTHEPTMAVPSRFARLGRSGHRRAGDHR